MDDMHEIGAYDYNLLPISTVTDAPSPSPPRRHHFKPWRAKPDLFTKILSLQADITCNCLVTICSPFKAIFSTANESYRRAEEETAMVESVILRLPINISQFSALLLRKVGSGIFGAVQMGFVLIMVMLLSGFLGFGLVHMLIEKPVFCRERLFFDYTDVNPTAVFGFGDGKQQMGIPVDHTYHVSLVLLMPESDYNREVGLFQAWLAHGCNSQSRSSNELERIQSEGRKFSTLSKRINPKRLPALFLRFGM